MTLKTIEWKDNSVIMIDQTKLPNALEYVTFTDYNQIAYNVYKEELNLDVVHSITQHIYLPGTDQYPETGAILYKKQKGNECS